MAASSPTHRDFHEAGVASTQCSDGAARTPRRSGTHARDGTQVGFELDADCVLNEINDDLLYHGDLNAALAG